MAAFLAGAVALTAQVLLLRELIFALGANEPSMGLMLAAWLAWTALGSGLPLAHKPRLALWLTLTAAGLPVALAAARLSPLAFGLTPGEIPRPPQIASAAVAATAAFAFPSGRVFAMIVRAGGASSGLSLARAYLFEAAGACAAGLLANFVLLGRSTPFTLAGLGAAVLLAAAAAFASRRPARLALSLAACAVAAGAFPAGARLDNLLASILHPGFHLRELRYSPYGSLAALEREDSRVILENGAVLLQFPDPQAAEEAVHFALLQHPAPQSALLIGGGLQGGILEAVRHPSLQRLDYVELDPALFALARRHLNPVWRAAEGDPRVRLHSTDGRSFLRAARASYDVVILNLPPPATLMWNRFYTAEFFRLAQEKLSGSGVLSVRLPGGENFIGEARAAVLRSVAASMRQVFPQVAGVPGESVHLLALRAQAAPLLAAGQLLARLAARGIETQYLAAHTLPFRLAPERTQALQALLEGTPPVNRDFRPVATHLETLAWSARTGPFRPWLLAAALAILAALAIALGGVFMRGAPAVCVAATGLTSMVLQVLLVAAFQVVHGSAYREIALLMAAFMAGIAAGAAIALRTQERTDRLYLAASQLVVLASAPAIMLAVRAWESPWIFWLAALLCGLCGGFQFPVAARLDASAAPGQPARPGALYAADLAGACAGAFLVATAFLPLYGFFWAAAALAALNVGPLAWASFSALPVRNSRAAR